MDGAGGDPCPIPTRVIRWQYKFSITCITGPVEALIRPETLICSWLARSSHDFGQRTIGDGGTITPGLWRVRWPPSRAQQQEGQRGHCCPLPWAAGVQPGPPCAASIVRCNSAVFPSLGARCCRWQRGRGAGHLRHDRRGRWDQRPGDGPGAGNEALGRRGQLPGHGGARARRREHHLDGGRRVRLGGGAQQLPAQ